MVETPTGGAGHPLSNEAIAAKFNTLTDGVAARGRIGKVAGLPPEHRETGKTCRASRPARSRGGECTRVKHLRKPASHCAIYARTATAHQADGSVDAQITCCREFAARSGWEVVDEDIYVDSGTSGLSKEHPALNELIATVSSFRQFEYVLVVSVDRLSRSFPEFVTLVDI
jgi:Resolvase, N terminal domain